MRDNNIISILDVLLTETTLVTKTDPGPVRIWDRYRRGPRFVRILDWSNLGRPHRHQNEKTSSFGLAWPISARHSRSLLRPVSFLRRHRGTTTSSLRLVGVTCSSCLDLIMWSTSNYEVDIYSGSGVTGHREEYV